MTAVVGVDVGGTFTDLVAWVDDRLIVTKTPSRPDQADGVVEALDLAVVRAELCLHGTTVATNALLERSGARVMLVTDPGFEDLVEIGRQHRSSLYDPDSDREPPLVERHMRTGGVDPQVVDECEAVVVASLGGFADSSTERRWAGEIGRLRPELPVTLAGSDFPEFREFERINTAVVNAFLRPPVESYLRNLQRRLVPERVERLMVMRSSGGLLTTEEAGRRPATILVSGPAGGVVAAAEMGRLLGLDRLIAFDMGGTSTDVTLIEDGKPDMTPERLIGGQVVRAPSVAVHTVGAGGGSLGWVDPGGALRVGPRSAGAFPGPACYGRGGSRPTITDANVVLGRLPSPPGLELDDDAARRAVGGIADQIGLAPVETARGMVEVVEATIDRAVRFVSIEKGVDPSRAALVAFGGAGGLHATAVARRLGMAKVVVPPLAGVFSALGLLLSAPRHDLVQTVLTDRQETVDRRLGRLMENARQEFWRGLGVTPTVVESWVDVRYHGQSHELTVDYSPGEGWEALAARFHHAHRVRNGFSRTDDPIEAVTLRVAARGAPTTTLDRLLDHRPRGPGRVGTRSVIVDSSEMAVEVWRRAGMAVGATLTGPAIVIDDQSTTWVGVGERAGLHPSGALEIEW